VGVGEASLSPAAYSMVADAFPKARLTTALSIYQTGAKIGAAAAFTLGGLAIGFVESRGDVAWPLLGRAAPWHVVMLLLGAPGCCWPCCLSPSASRPALNAKAVGHRDAFIRFLKQHAMLMFLLTFGCTFIRRLHQQPDLLGAHVIERHYGWKAIQYGPALGAISIAGAIALVIKGGIVDWLFGRGMKDAHIRFYTWLLAAMIPVAWGMFFVPSPVAFLLLYGLLQTTAMIFMVFLSATMVLIAPPQIRGS